MAKLAVAMIILGSFLSRSSLEDVIDRTFPDAQLRVIIGVILLIIGLYMLHKKTRLFNIR